MRPMNARKWIATVLAALALAPLVGRAAPAFTMQVHPGIFFGAETRYMRNYDGIGFDPFAGEVLFVGPTMYSSLSRNMAISAAWSVQVAGHAFDIPGSLDLRNFERHQAKLRLMYNF